jgi:hypothetical protein
MKKNMLIVGFVIALYLLVLSSPCSALLSLPEDAGINYKTMTIVDSSKLKSRGMKKAKNGDAVEIAPSGDGNLLITDKATGERIKWIYSK